VALNLYGVTFNEAHGNHAVPTAGTSLVVVRDLAAIVGESEYAMLEPTPERVTQYTAIVSDFAKRGPVLPAPVGVVFKHGDAVQRWLELHYVALSDALSFVDNRVVARCTCGAPARPTSARRAPTWPPSPPRASACCVAPPSRPSRCARRS
jgi:Gas vesicle synthesis protein GvpL/GvpF.